MPSTDRESDQVFVFRCWRELEFQWPAASEWRVQVSVIQERRRYVFEGVESAFEFVKSKLHGTKVE